MRSPSPSALDRRGALRVLGGAVAAATMPDAALGSIGQVPAPVPERVRAGVLDIGYVEAGPAAGRPVVLMHGFPYDIHCFDEVAPRLASAGHRVVMPYQRGFGPTRFVDAATPRVGQQAALAADLLALLDALGIRRAVLAGFDWGARTACVTAALHPERVVGIVSAGGAGYNIQNENDFAKPRAAAWERLHWFYYYLDSERGQRAFASDPAAFCRYLWREFSPTWRFDEATFARTAASFANPDFVAVALHSYRYRIAGVPGDPALAAVERRLAASPVITVPAIILQGADEGVDRPEPREAITPHFSALRRVSVLEGIGHNAPQEAPALFAAAVLDLLR